MSLILEQQFNAHHFKFQFNFIESEDEIMSFEEEDGVEESDMEEENNENEKPVLTPMSISDVTEGMWAKVIYEEEVFIGKVLTRRGMCPGKVFAISIWNVYSARYGKGR